MHYLKYEIKKINKLSLLDIKKKKEDKKGQFYLLSAIVIIGVMTGFAAVSNYTKKKEVIKVYDVGEELGIEGENVLDYGIYNQYDEQAMQELLANFSETYYQYVEEGKNVYFIFGNADRVIILGYTDMTSGSVSITDESGTTSLQITEEGQFYEEVTPQGNKVVIEVEGNEYEFKLKPGENFYFVITENVDGERYVVQG